MLRKTFIAGGAAAFAVRRPAAAQHVAVNYLVENFPGIIGIYCRTLAEEPPLVAVRATDRFPAASIIKLPIMLTVYQAYERRAASPDEDVTLLPGDVIAGNPILGDAHSGQRWPMGLLLDAMIQYSDNTASNALISHFGFAAINATIRNAGMTAGMSDSPTINSGRRPSSKSVTSMPFCKSSEASVAPAGPLPMIPTVFTDVLIIQNWVFCLVTNAG